MNIIKNLFTDLENLLNLLNNFDYTKLLLLTIILAIIYLINIILVNKYYKPRINKTKIELKKINLEATLNNKRQYLLKIYLILFLFISFFMTSLKEIFLFFKHNIKNFLLKLNISLVLLFNSKVS